MDVAEKQEYIIVCDSGFGHIVANLDSEELKKLKPNPEEQGTYKLGSLEFIDPSEITSYRCTIKCKKAHQEKPKTEVYVKQYTGSGRARALVSYLCNTCDEAVFGFYSDPSLVDSKYITFDETGNYVKPTPESIDELLDKAFIEAKKGAGIDLRNGNYEKSIVIEETWAQKISYAIGEKVEAIHQEHEKAYILRLQTTLPEVLDDLLARADFGFSLAGVEEVGECTFSSTAETFMPIYEHIDKLKIEDPEIKKKVLKVFSLYKGMHQNVLDELEEKEKEIQKEKAQRQNIMGRIEERIQKYIGQVNLSPEEVKEADDIPIGREDDFELGF